MNPIPPHILHAWGAIEPMAKLSDPKRLETQRVAGRAAPPHLLPEESMALNNSLKTHVHPQQPYERHQETWEVSWPRHAFPLNVYIPKTNTHGEPLVEKASQAKVNPFSQPSHDIASQRSENADAANHFEDLVKAACATWQNACTEMLQFEFILYDVGEDLNTTLHTQQGWIMLEWLNDTTPGRPFEVGHAHRKVNARNHLESVWIQLIQYPEIDKALSPELHEKRLFATLLHEIGHALGLDHGHSPQAVMHHQGWRNVILHSEDIHALHKRYNQHSSGLNQVG